MPNIPEYTSQTIASTGINPGAGPRGLSLVQPTERGSDAAANLGRTQSALANASGNAIASGVGALAKAGADVAIDYLTWRDEQKFNKDQPDYWSAGVLGWKKYSSENDITDVSKVTQFNANLEKQDEEFLDQFNSRRGKEMAMNEIRRRRDHLSQVQIADVATRTGAQAQQSMIDSVGKNAAIVQQDPHFLDVALENTDEMVRRAMGNAALTEGQRAQFEQFGRTSKREIAQTAFLSMAQNNPTAALAAIESGWQDKVLTPDDRDNLTKLARVFQREERADADRAVVQAQKAEQKATAAKFAETYNNHFNAADGTWNDLTGFARDVKQILTTFPETAGPTARSALDMVERLTKEANGEPLPVADPDTAEDFRRRLLLPPDDPNRLTDEQVFAARAAGRLSNQEFAFYKDGITSLAKDPDKRAAYGDFSKFLSGMKSSMTASNALTGQRDPKGDQRFYQFSVDMRSQFDAAYRTGGDWKALINPSSANYLGKQASPYQLSNKQSLQSFKGTYDLNAPAPGAAAPVGNPDARKPGESIEAWLSRRGK